MAGREEARHRPDWPMAGEPVREPRQNGRMAFT